MNTEPTTTTYVAYLLPGVFLSEESVKPIMVRNPQQQADDAPNNAFAFSYFDIVTTILDVEGEHIKTSSSRRNISKTYYIDAELLNADQAVEQFGSQISSRIDSEPGSGIVVCCTGNLQPFNPSKNELVSTS